MAAVVVLLQTVLQVQLVHQAAVAAEHLLVPVAQLFMALKVKQVVQPVHQLTVQVAVEVLVQ
jgi:hypothetical protein